MNRLLKLVSCLLVSTSLLAAAQVPYVPAELLDNAVRMQGDRVSICVFGGLDTTEFDRAATSLIADALLLDHTVTEIPSDFPLYDEVDFFYTLYIHLVNDCDMIAGLSLTAGIYPEWLAVTAPYASLPFVVAAVDPDYGKLGDVPRDRAVGVQIGSQGDMGFLAYNTSLPADDRWLRLPYGDDELMLQRLAEGSIDAAMIWLPDLLSSPVWHGGDYRIIDSAPLPSQVAEIGFASLANQNWLLEEFDAAIEELTSSGALGQLAIDYGVTLGDTM